MKQQEEIEFLRAENAQLKNQLAEMLATIVALGGGLPSWKDAAVRPHL